MIDIESQVYTKVYDAVKAEYPSCNITSVTTLIPTEFPAVSVEETDNYSYRATRDSSTNEHDVVVTYEVNIFSNKTFNKKTEAKNILEIVDDTMNDLGFTRLSKVPMSANESAVYRLAARYRGVVGKNEVIYRS